MTNCIPAFTADAMQRAFDDWGCNCGPGALAAIAGLTLEQIRPLMGDFEAKGYTNPTLMLDCLHRLYVSGGIKGWRKGDKSWPIYGLARIQWEGPWTKPGVPMRVRYRHTHWVGAAQSGGSVGIFDINAMANGTGWCPLHAWRDVIVPWILSECVPRADGKWHITHAIEVDR